MTDKQQTIDHGLVRSFNMAATGRIARTFRMTDRAIVGLVAWIHSGSARPGEHLRPIIALLEHSRQQ